MTEKILILYRKENTLEIQDEDNTFSYLYMWHITHIKKDETKYGVSNRIFGIFNGGYAKGIVSNVKEIKEVW